MTKNLPAVVIAAVHEIVRQAEANNEVLDAYGMAERVMRTFPEENLEQGELIAFMLRSGLQAMEFSPTDSLLIEVILPPGAPPEEDGDTDEAHPGAHN